jgi:hypothetical protein
MGEPKLTNADSVASGGVSMDLAWEEQSCGNFQPRSLSRKPAKDKCKLPQQFHKEPEYIRQFSLLTVTNSQTSQFTSPCSKHDKSPALYLFGPQNGEAWWNVSDYIMTMEKQPPRTQKAIP